MEKLLHFTDKKSEHKALGILITCVLLQAIPFSIAAYLQALFMPFVTKQYGFSLAAFSLVFTVGSVSSALVSPLIGRLYDKINTKVLFIAGTALTGLGYMGYSLAHTLPMFYAMAIVVHLGCCVFSNLGIPFVIAKWYPPQDSGKALGIAFAGSSFGNIFLQTITMDTIVRKGTSFSYFIFGVIALITGVMLSVLFIRLPKDMEKAQQKTATATSGMGLKQVNAIAASWVYRVSFGIIMIAAAALTTQYAEYFRNGLGIEARLIGVIGSTYAACSFIGNIGGGALFDKMGSFKTMVISGVGMLVAIAALLLAKHIHGLAFVFAVAYGLSSFCLLTGPAYVTKAAMGDDEYAKKLGSVHLFTYGGYAGGSFLFAAVADKAGFATGWMMVAAIAIVGFIMLLTSLKVLKKKMQAAA